MELALKTWKEALQKQQVDSVPADSQVPPKRGTFREELKFRVVIARGMCMRFGKEERFLEAGVTTEKSEFSYVKSFTSTRLTS